MDDELQVTLTMRGYTGVPTLPNNNLMEELKLENKISGEFKATAFELKRILNEIK